jgi:hypothetical protein
MSRSVGKICKAIFRRRASSLTLSNTGSEPNFSVLNHRPAALPKYLLRYGGWRVSSYAICPDASAVATTESDNSALIDFDPHRGSPT